MPTFWIRLMQVVMVVIIALVVLFVLSLFSLGLPALLIKAIWVLLILYAIGILFGWVAGPPLPF